MKRTANRFRRFRIIYKGPDAELADRIGTVTALDRTGKNFLVRFDNLDPRRPRSIKQTHCVPLPPKSLRREAPAGLAGYIGE